MIVQIIAVTAALIVIVFLYIATGLATFHRKHAAAVATGLNVLLLLGVWCAILAVLSVGWLYILIPMIPSIWGAVPPLLNVIVVLVSLLPALLFLGIGTLPLIRYFEVIRSKAGLSTARITQVVSRTPTPLGWLIITSGAGVGTEYDLDTESITFGRHSHNHIVLDDPTVSGQHAQVRCEQGRFIVYDMGSTNGIWVNGQQIHRHKLSNGDLVQIGETTFSFRTVFIQDEMEQWYKLISDQLWEGGQVGAHEFDGPPTPLNVGVLHDYMDDHSDIALEYREEGELLVLKNQSAFNSLQVAWSQFLEAEDNSSAMEPITSIVQVLRKITAKTEQHPLDVECCSDFWISSLDVSLVFESLNISHILPIAFTRRSQVQPHDIVDIRHKLSSYQSDRARIVLVLVGGTDEDVVHSQAVLDERLQKPYAVDGIALGINQILQVIVSKRPAATFRRQILSHVELLNISPFNVESVADELFVGRELELRTISEHVTTASYSIIGGRRVGKTSVLQRLHRTCLPTMGFRSVFHDCSVTPTYEVFTATRIHSWQPDAPSTPYLTFADLLQFPCSDKPLVLLLDEADKWVPVDRRQGWQLFNYLRALANSGAAQVVLSGERTLIEALRDSASPLFNFTNAILLGPLDYPAVRELVIQPMKQLDIELVDESAVVNAVWSFTSGHPYIIQRLCRRLVEKLDEQRLRYITPDNVNSVIHDPSFQRDDFLDTYWQSATSLEKIISLVMVHNDNARSLHTVRQALVEHCNLKPPAREVDIALQRLVDLRSILKRTRTGYEFAVDAFSRVVSGTVTMTDMLEIHTEEYQEQNE